MSKKHVSFSVRVILICCCNSIIEHFTNIKDLSGACSYWLLPDPNREVLLLDIQAVTVKSYFQFAIMFVSLISTYFFRPRKCCTVVWGWIHRERENTVDMGTDSEKRGVRVKWRCLGMDGRRQQRALQRLQQTQWCMRGGGGGAGGEGGGGESSGLVI